MPVMVVVREEKGAAHQHMESHRPTLCLRRFWTFSVSDASRCFFSFLCKAREREREYEYGWTEEKDKERKREDQRGKERWTTQFLIGDGCPLYMCVKQQPNKKTVVQALRGRTSDGGTNKSPGSEEPHFFPTLF